MHYVNNEKFGGGERIPEKLSRGNTTQKNRKHKKLKSILNRVHTSSLDMFESTQLITKKTPKQKQATPFRIPPVRNASRGPQAEGGRGRGKKLWDFFPTKHINN